MKIEPGYFEQDDCRAIIAGLPMKKRPPKPEPTVRWKLMGAIAGWAAIFGLTMQWVLHQ